MLAVVNSAALNIQVKLFLLCVCILGGVFADELLGHVEVQSLAF